MPTIALQHYKRGSHYYASIIETFRDPVTRKNSSPDFGSFRRYF